LRRNTQCDGPQVHLLVALNAGEDEEDSCKEFAKHFSPLIRLTKLQKEDIEDFFCTTGLIGKK